MGTITAAITALKKGKIIIVVDDKNRENEGDFICAAEFATPKNINFLITVGRGLVCMPITPPLAKKLALPPMVTKNTSKHTTNFTVSIDAKQNITTGISTFDRAETIRLAVAKNPKANDFVRPGHIFPLVANPKGVLARPGHTEATIDLLKLAKLQPVGVLCEILDPSGHSAKHEYLLKIAKKYRLQFISIAELKTFLKNTSTKTAT